MFTSRLPLDAVLQHLSSTSCASIAVLPISEVVSLVANIIAFSYQRVAKMTAIVSVSYLRVLTILLGLIPVDSLEKKKKGPVDEDEDMDDADWKAEELAGSSLRSPAGLDPRIMRWLSLAYDNNHLNDMLGSLEPTDASLDVLTPESIGQITQLLLNLITVFPSHKISILNNLMYFRFDSCMLERRKLKGRIAIEFIDQHGISEAGIDGGGVFKEFLTSLVHQAFDTNYGLFLNTSDQLLYPNPHAFAREATQLKHYEFLGRILGKALYEGILIDAAFAGFFLGKCLGQVNYLDDLPSLDPELYRGLMFLKNYEGNVDDLSLFFTVDDEEMGTTITRELIPNGSNIAVTRQNRIRYIYMTAHYRLNTQIYRQCKAFFQGLSDLIDPKWLWMFNEQELQVMLGGAQTEISLEDLKKNVVYSNFEVRDPTIQFFWSVVQEMTEEDRRLLIKFITSCARPPLLGFAELNPKLCIRHAGVEENRLPTSSTCMNLLKLPAFSTRQRLKEKLMYAIHSEAGFDLS
ncbi:hypothetical protein BGZ82_010341 [Podila clonocystis]|nr:hypothetical protein BGZ82_010341 [Podila clonocystis]